MNTDEIKQLLAKYYAGETDEMEEISLMAFFARPDVPDELETDRQLFAQLYNMGSGDGHQRIERRMARQIDTWNTVEKGSRHKAQRLSIRWMVATAASALLLFTLGTVLFQNSEKRRLARQEATQATPMDTYNDPDEAYKKAEMALAQFSRSLNKGLKIMEKSK